MIVSPQTEEGFDHIFSLFFLIFLQYCVLSPVKWSDLRKSKSMDPDLHHLHRPLAVGGAYQPELLSSGLLSSSSSISSFSDAGSRTLLRFSDLVLSSCLSCDPLPCPPDKLLSARVYPDPPIQRPGLDSQGGSGLMLMMGRQESSKPWTAGVNGGSSASSTAAAPRGFGGAVGEVDEETKKNQNIINIVREGQISLLVSEEKEEEKELHPFHYGEICITKTGKPYCAI